MDFQHKRKTLVDIDLSIWAQVKHFATIEKTSVNEAVKVLLKTGLRNCGYIGYQDKIISTGPSFEATDQQISQSSK